MPPFHLNTREWAQTVIEDTVTFSFRGIDKVDPGWHRKHQRMGTRKHQMPPNTLAAALMADEQYMQKLFDGEAASYLTAELDEEWREYCAQKAHTRYTCPHEHKEAYEAAVAKLLKDDSERYTWAADRVEWDFLREDIVNWTTDVDVVEQFLKDHPVDAVLRSHDEWVDIDDVEVYCTGCDEPHMEQELLRADVDQFPTCHNCNDDIDVRQRSSVPGSPKRFTFCGTQYDTAIEEL